MTLIEQQSVRHHLSLNRLFERQPRPVSDPGFGSYWTVNLEAPPGTKRPRKRGRPQREVSGDGEPAPAKKRGRPRKMPETESSRRTELRRIATLPIPSVEHVGAHVSVSSTRTGSRRRYEDEEEDPKVPSELGASWCREEDLESEDELPQRPITPAYDRAVTIRFSPSPIRETVHQLQDDYTSDAFPENIIDHLRVQMGTLRRQASEARTEASRMAQQLLESQADVSKTRIALKVAEDMLEAEVRKRREAERVAEEEGRLRKAVEDELQALQAREPGTLGGGG
jgi:Forkhead domain